MKKDHYCGLSRAQIELSRRLHGDNRLKRNRHLSVAQRFLIGVIILLIMAVATYILIRYGQNIGAFIAGSDIQTLLITGSIGLVILSIIISSVVWLIKVRNRRYKQSDPYGDKAIVSVIRDELPSTVECQDLLVGDIVRLNEGETVPADGELLEACDMVTNETSLDGPERVDKTAQHDSRYRQIMLKPYMVWRGSQIISGSGIMRVRSVGYNTRLGEKIALEQ